MKFSFPRFKTVKYKFQTRWNKVEDFRVLGSATRNNEIIIIIIMYGRWDSNDSTVSQIQSPPSINKAELWWCIDGPSNASHALINHAMLAGFDNRLSLANALSVCVCVSVCVLASKQYNQKANSLSLKAQVLAAAAAGREAITRDLYLRLAMQGGGGGGITLWSGERMLDDDDATTFFLFAQTFLNSFLYFKLPTSTITKHDHQWL